MQVVIEIVIATAHLLYLYFENVLMNINVKAKVQSPSIIDKLDKFYLGG